MNSIERKAVRLSVMTLAVMWSVSTANWLPGCIASHSVSAVLTFLPNNTDGQTIETAWINGMKSWKYLPSHQYYAYRFLHLVAVKIDSIVVQ